MASEIVRLWMPDPFEEWDGELPEQATRVEAEQRAEKIRSGFKRFLTDTAPHMLRAYVCRDWSSLGYGSWESYVREEWGVARLRLPEQERQAITRVFRMYGASTRAIGSALNVDRRTVRRDLAVSGGADAPPEVVGMDGKRYAARPTPADIIDAEVVDPPAAPVAGPEPAGPADAPEQAPPPADEHARPPAALPVPEPAAQVEDQDVEVVAGPVRIRVGVHRGVLAETFRDGLDAAVVLDVAHAGRTLGEEWQNGDNEDPLRLGVALDEDDLDELINVLLDAKARLRRIRGGA